jgi:hypothetical protein
MHMPVIVRIGRFSFVIYVDDHTPAHVHAKAAGAEAKIYLSNGMCFWARGFDQKTINWLEKVVLEHSEVLWEAWHEYHKEEA